MTSQSPTDLPYLLWRTHPGPTHERFPEVIATDGRVIRRIGTLERQIYIQHFEAQPTARALVQRIEAGLSREHSIIGYSMMSGDAPVAIRVTGTPGDPGWLAFPDRGALPPELRPADARTTLPQLAIDIPQRRLVAGAITRWRRDRLELHCAIEERGTSQAPALLPHITAITLIATRPDAGALAELSLGRRPPEPEPAADPSADRRDIVIPLPERPARDLLADPEVRFWLRIELHRDLLCLPPRWRTFDLEIRPALHHDYAVRPC